MRDFKFYFRPFFGVVLLSELLASCMVGPNFRHPVSPPVKQFTESTLPNKTVASKGKGGQAQVFRKDKDIPLLWWELYHSPEINELVKLA